MKPCATQEDKRKVEILGRSKARQVSAQRPVHNLEFGKPACTEPTQYAPNCSAHNHSSEKRSAVQRDIDRVQRIWCDCRTRHGGGGPWLFGTFSVADEMYATVASRFATYGIDGPAVVRDYVKTVLGDPDIAAWYAAAAEESSVIEEEEVGQA